jgi:hypothetical protein
MMGFLHMFIPSQVAAAGRPGSGDDPGSALSVSHNINGWRAYLAEIRLLAIKPSQAGICVGDSSRNRLIYFMSQGSGQLSHGGRPVNACEIGLHLT